MGELNSSELSLLFKLLEARGVSGDEGEVRNIVKDECKARGVSFVTDALGNVIASRPRPGAKRIMLDAHMDEVGLLITGADKDGMLRYQPVGGIDTRVMMAKRFLIGRDRVPGVTGIKPIHLATAQDMENALKHSDIRLDIGAKDKAEAEKFCPPGCTAVFDSPPTLFGDGRIVSRALDDRLGCFILLRALDELDLPYDITCVFSVQEEVGLRGAKAATKRVRPDIGIALEGTACNDIGPLDLTRPATHITRQGEGVAISFMDRASIAHKGLLSAVVDCAKANAIPYQMKRGITGGNNAGAIQRADYAVPTVALSVPCRYIHSAQSVVKLSDVASARDLAIRFLYDLPGYEGRVF